MNKQQLERRLRDLLRDVDCRVAADLLHDLAREKFLQYAAEAADAQYKYGLAAAQPRAAERSGT